jgi:hypothetical protein
MVIGRKGPSERVQLLHSCNPCERSWLGGPTCWPQQHKVSLDVEPVNLLATLLATHKTAGHGAGDFSRGRAWRRECRPCSLPLSA